MVDLVQEYLNKGYTFLEFNSLNNTVRMSKDNEIIDVFDTARFERVWGCHTRVEDDIDD